MQLARNVRFPPDSGHSFCKRRTQPHLPDERNYATNTRRRERQGQFGAIGAHALARFAYQNSAGFEVRRLPLHMGGLNHGPAEADTGWNRELNR